MLDVSCQGLYLVGKLGIPVFSWNNVNRNDRIALMKRQKGILGDRHHLIHILVYIRTYLGTISTVLIYSHEGHGVQILNPCYFEILKKVYSFIMVYMVRMIQTRISVRVNRHMSIVDTLSQPILCFCVCYSSAFYVAV